jgi:hypothetical protein
MTSQIGRDYFEYRVGKVLELEISQSSVRLGVAYWAH